MMLRAHVIRKRVFQRKLLCPISFGVLYASTTLSVVHYLHSHTQNNALPMPDAVESVKDLCRTRSLLFWAKASFFPLKRYTHTHCNRLLECIKEKIGAVADITEDRPIGRGWQGMPKPSQLKK